MTNARAASVGKNDTASRLEGLHETITSDGSSDLLGTGGNSELALGVETVLSCLTSDRSSARHVLVRRVGARTDQSDLELRGPVVLLDSLSELRKRGSQVGSEGTVDMGLELVQILRARLVTCKHLV